MLKPIKILILLLAASLAIPVFAAPKAKPQKLADMVLTYREFQTLHHHQKITYIKFLVRFLGTIESMQSFPAAKKTALREQILRIFEVLPSAHAVDNYVRGDASIVGKTCIYGLNVSQYARNANGRYTCQSVGGNACSGGQVQCGQQITQFYQG